MESSDWDMIEHFSLDGDPNLACPCCGKADLDLQLMVMLDRARDFAGVPFKINSGFRCEEHNAEVEGKPTSSHLTGKAVDIAIPADNLSRFKIIEGLFMAGFKRMGEAKTFVHVDVDPDKPSPRKWPY